MSTLQAMRNEVRLQADVDVTDASDAEITSALNYAYQEAIGDEPWDFLLARVTFTTVPNQEEYPLVGLGGTVSPDIEGHRVLHVAMDGYKLEYLHPTRYFAVQPFGQVTPYQGTSASHWTVLDGTKLVLFPEPTSAVNVQVVYKRVAPDLILDNDIPLFPGRYHQIFKLGALVKIYQKIYDFESADSVNKEFQDRLESMRNELLQSQPQSLWSWGEGDNIDVPWEGRLRFPFE